MLGRLYVARWALALMASGMAWGCSSSQPGPLIDAATTTDAADDTPAADAGTVEDGADDAPSCTTMAPASCTGAAPSFAGEILPILNAKCNNCHTGFPQPWPLSDWADVQAWALSISADLTQCAMPPADAGTPSMTKAELDAVLGWIVCGAPNN